MDNIVREYKTYLNKLTLCNFHLSTNDLRTYNIIVLEYLILTFQLSISLSNYEVSSLLITV